MHAAEDAVRLYTGAKHARDVLVWRGAHEKGDVDVHQIPGGRVAGVPVVGVHLEDGADDEEQGAEEEEGPDAERDRLDGVARGLPDAAHVEDHELVQLRLALDIHPLRPVSPVLPGLPYVAPAQCPWATRAGAWPQSEDAWVKLEKVKREVRRGVGQEGMDGCGARLWVR